MPRKEPTGVLMPRHKKALWAAVRALESELGSCSDRTDPFQRERRKELQKAEEEQAATIHWLVNLYLKHGEDWATHANAALAAHDKQSGVGRE